jgi:hypothetical protein
MAPNPAEHGQNGKEVRPQRSTPITIDLPLRPTTGIQVSFRASKGIWGDREGAALRLRCMDSDPRPRPASWFLSGYGSTVAASAPPLGTPCIGAIICLGA